MNSILHYEYGKSRKGFIYYRGVNRTNLPAQHKGHSWKPDGTVLYLTRHNSPDSVASYSVSVPWDVTSTLTLTGSTPATTVEGASSSTGHYFTPDGALLYVCTDAGAFKVLKYALSTPWNVSTATFVHSATLGSIPMACSLSIDGMSLFVNISPSAITRKYALSTAFDISSITAVTTPTQTMSNGTGYTLGMYFALNGKKVYLVGAPGGVPTIYERTLTTPYDISSIQGDKSVGLTPPITVGNFDSVYISPDGKIMTYGLYLTSIYKFDLNVPFNINGGLIIV